MNRYLFDQVQKDVQRKMVFLGGPRQVGKTTLALQIIGQKTGYLNWDVPQDRERILKRELPATDVIVFDEIHKYRSWRNYLKGLYDARHPVERKILVTGSARLDLYRFGGDSLQGRYHFLRLHPLSAAELKMKDQKDLSILLHLGGFPEPFLSGSDVEAKRWSREYRTRLIQDDIASLERLQDFGNLELLILRLPQLVGNPLSINGLREDLQVSHKTLAKWVGVLERMYAIFRLSPLGSSKIRAVKKEQKHYHFDWSLVPEEPQRFENMVACHLIKWVHWLQDTQGRDVELAYFRDVEGKEVDFVVVEGKKPLVMVECKWGDDALSKSLQYLRNKFPQSEAWQLHMTGKKDYESPEGIRVAPAIVFLKELV